jgi:glycosyltransferase involved in cell wall biosynthesis
MKVAYLTHYADLYGANRCMLDLMLQAREAHGVEPHVLLAADGPLTAELDRHGIPHAVLPWQPWVDRHVYMGGPHHRIMQHYRRWRKVRARAAHNAALVPRLAAQARAWDIGLLHVNSSVIGIGGALARALGVPWIWHVRELFGLHYGYQADGGPRAFARALRQADAVLAMSAAVRAELLREAGGDLPVEVVYDGVYTKAQAGDLAARGQERWARTTPFRFVLVALFHPGKGQLEAVEALAQVRARGADAQLVLVGGGEVGPVVKCIEELALKPHVKLTGFVPDAMPHILGAHCALSCSRHEAYGRATLEALTSGIPVIGHASGGTPELIDHRRTGLLYQHPGELRDHMLELCDDPQWAWYMGQAAMEGFAAQRSIEAMAHEVVRVYWAVLRRPLP